MSDRFSKGVCDFACTPREIDPECEYHYNRCPQCGAVATGENAEHVMTYACGSGQPFVTRGACPATPPKKAPYKVSEECGHYLVPNHVFQYNLREWCSLECYVDTQPEMVALREIATAARCFYVCNWLYGPGTSTKEDLQMCADNLNKAILAEREGEWND